MTASTATATFALRAGMLMLLVLGIVVRPALGLVGELHAMEHAAGAGSAAHGHAHDMHRPHAQAGHHRAHAVHDDHPPAGHAHDDHVHAGDGMGVASAHVDADTDTNTDSNADTDPHAAIDPAAVASAHGHGHHDDGDRAHAHAGLAGDGHDPDHARGSHGLLHQADVGCSAGMLVAYGLPEAFGFAVMLPSSAWVSAPPQRSTSPFRPPIA